MSEIIVVSGDADAPTVRVVKIVQVVPGGRGLRSQAVADGNP
jgi:hypothetical protein